MTDRAIAVELGRLADAVERAALALESIEARQRPGADARAERLVRAIFNVLGNADFAAGDVLAIAAGPAPRPALSAAIAGSSAKSLGRLLREHQGEPIDGLRVERVGRRRWRICAIETTQSRGALNPWRT